MIFKWLCKRYGHKKTVKIRKTYRWPSEGTGVVDFCKECREECSRCKEAFTEWDIYYKRSIQGISLPSDEMEKLREQGVIEAEL